MPIARDCGSIYKLWALRRKTLPWIYFLNKVSTPLSRSTMANVISCSCSSMQTTPLLKCLGDKGSFDGTWTAICFDRRYDKDSSVAIAISVFSQLLDPVALLISWSTLLELFHHLLGQANIRPGLRLECWIISSLDYQPAPSSGSFLSSKKISYMALQRSSKTRERSSSCYTTFHCFGQQRLAWLVGEHIVCPQYCCTLFQASSYRQPLSHW